MAHLEIRQVQDPDQFDNGLDPVVVLWVVLCRRRQPLRVVLCRRLLWVGLCRRRRLLVWLRQQAWWCWKQLLLWLLLRPLLWLLLLWLLLRHSHGQRLLMVLIIPYNVDARWWWCCWVWHKRSQVPRLVFEPVHVLLVLFSHSMSIVVYHLAQHTHVTLQVTRVPGEVAKRFAQRIVL